MKRLVAAVFVLGLGAADVAAQPDPGGFGPPPAETDGGSHMRKPEVLTGRPSGFWTSNRPAKGARYRWRIMAAGGLILAITGFFVARAVRNANAGSVRDDATNWQPSRARRGR